MLMSVKTAVNQYLKVISIVHPDVILNLYIKLITKII